MQCPLEVQAVKAYKVIATEGILGILTVESNRILTVLTTQQSICVQRWTQIQTGKKKTRNEKSNVCSVL